MALTPESSAKRHALFICVLIPAALFYFTWSWTGQIGFLGGDGPNYLMLAAHFTPYGTTDPVYDAIGSASRFPPLYSALLGLFDASANLPRAHALTAACLVCALVAFYAWMLGAGFSRFQAVLQVLMLVLLPETWHAALAIQSEYLYLGLSLLTLALLGRHEKTGDRDSLFLASAVIGIAILTREVGLSLLVPLMLCSWRVSRPTVLLTLAIAILPFACWHQLHHAPVTYGRILGTTYADGGWAVLKQQLIEELPALRDGFSANFTTIDGFGTLTRCIGAVCLASAFWRAVRGKLDALYVAANLAILMVWPYPEEAERFIWVLVPLLLAQPPLLLAQVRKETPDARAPRSLLAFLAVVSLMMSLPTLCFAVQARREAALERAPGALGYQIWYVVDRSDASYGVGFESTIVQALTDAQAVVPPGDCIMAPRPDMVSYFTRRRAYFLPRESVPDRDFETELRAEGCHYVFVYGVGDARYPTLMYPSGRIADYSEVVLERRRNNARGHVKPLCRIYRLK